jgi:HEAT repeat protein/beta-lactamase regulating signal transducer with metallopeptidase domain
MTMQAFLSSLAGAAPFAAELAFKAALWLVAILMLTAILRASSAATRHLVCSLGVAGLFAMPFLLNGLPWRIAVPLAVAPDAHRAQPGPSGNAPSPSPLPVSSSEAATAITPPSLGDDRQSLDVAGGAISTAAMLSSIATALLGVWALGALLLLVRLARSVIHVRRILAAATASDDAHLSALLARLAQRIGIRRPVRLVVARGTAIPFTVGTLNPVVALPVGASEWSADKQEAVLLHELAHVARLDLWTSLAAHVACALYWFNPLVWMASRKMRIEGEKACDDAVLRFGTRASDYADQLLQVVRDTRNRWAPAVAVAMARRSAFEGRLLAILSPEINRRRLTLRLGLPIALGVALLSLPIAAMRPADASPTVSDASKPPDTAKRATLSEEQEPATLAVPAQDTVSRSAVARSLSAALRDSDERVRVAAVQAIASREERSVISDLIPLLGDAEVAVRRAAAEALLHMPDPRAIAALVEALRSDADASVRELAAQALGQIDDERAVPGLTAALRAERIPAVRRKIVWALAEIESASAAAAFIEALRDDDAEVRQYAIAGVGSLELKSAAPQIIPLLRDPNADVRSRAAWALGELKSSAALEELMAATSDANADVRQHTISALSSLEDQRALPAFLRALRDANVDVRRQAVSAIADLDDLQRAPRELIDALSDADVDVRESAIHALGNIKDASTVAAIIPLARSGQPLAIREASIEALSELGGTQVEALLLDLMKDPDPKIRRLAAQGLGRD